MSSISCLTGLESLPVGSIRVCWLPCSGKLAFRSKFADEDPFPKMLDGEAYNILGPYVATETSTVVKALNFAGIGAPDCIIDLGSGDGRFCVAAVQQFEARASVGIEIDLKLVQASQEHARACEVGSKACFTCADLTDPSLDILTLAGHAHPFTLAIVFLLPESEPLFERHVRRLYDAGVRILSLAFALDNFKGLQLLKSEHPLYLYGRASCA